MFLRGSVSSLRRQVAAVFVLAPLAAASAAAAEFPTTPKAVTSPPAGAADSFVEAVGTPTGFVASWNRAASNEFSVLIQRFQADGTAIGKAAIVDEREDGELSIEGRPELVDLGGGKIGVAWKGAGPSLKGAVYDTATGKVGKTFTYLAAPYAASLMHDLALMKNGRVALVTRSFQTGGEDTTLFVLDNAMKQVGPSRIVEDDTYGPGGIGTYEQTVVAHGSGGLALYRASDFQVKATRFDGSGNLGETFTVNTSEMIYPYYSAYIRFTIKAEPLPNGGFVVSWPIFDAGQINVFNVHARVYGADGKPVGKDFIVHRDVSGEQVQQEVVVFENGFGIGWHNGQKVGGYLTQRMRFFDLEGRPASDDIVTERFGNDGPSGIAIAGDDAEYAALPNGGFVKLFVADGRIYGDGVPRPLLTSSTGDVIVGSADANLTLGLEGNDEISAGAGADAIDGGEGDDEIDGGPGADEIVGAGGNDVIRGGAGPDVFAFRPKGGRDTILDFEPVDRIDASAFHYNSRDAVAATARQVGKDVVITLVDQTDPAAPSATVRLKRYKLANFTSANVVE